MKPFAPLSSYPLSWNGLRFSVPEDWEPIVKGNAHFIYECELRPVLEIRWETPARYTSPDDRLKTVIADVSKKKSDSLVYLKPPVFLADISDHFQLRCYGGENTAEPDGACMVCRECGTIILVHFFPGIHDHFAELCTFFQGFACNTGQDQALPWTIQDITFRPPDSFELEGFSFGYGISTIVFKNKKSLLTLCRLAPASKHLENVSLQELFCRFTQTSAASHQVLDRNTIVHSSRPGLVPRLLSSLGRKHPYTWSRFMHIEQADRILGILLKSSAPLVQDHIDTIGDSYGLLQ